MIPTTGAFSTTGDMTTARGYATATLLANGKVLIAGGAIPAPAFPMEPARSFTILPLERLPPQGT